MADKHMSREALAPRDDFPVLDTHTYLNQAAIGLIPMPVQRYMREYDRDVAGSGTVSFDDEAEKRALEVPRKSAAGMIGADARDVAITANATEALNQLAWFLQPQAGQNVVSIDVEFPSVTYPWLRVAEATGCEVRLLPAEQDPSRITVEDLAELVDDRTAVICVSHVQYATGHLLDTKKLRKLADSVGAVLIVDATQSAGVVPLDIADGMDALIASSYKWLGGPCGAGFCYLRADLRERLRPPLVGWRGMVDPPAFNARRLDFTPDARRLETGTPSYTAALGMGAAIDYLSSFGVSVIHEHVLAVSRELADGLTGLGATITSPLEDDARAGIVAARFDMIDSGELAAELVSHNVVVGSRIGSVRFATHLFNGSSDVDRALEVVQGILKRRKASA